MPTKILISFLGDSITDANWIKHNYVSLVGEYLDVDVQNCGVSGATVGISKRNSPWENFQNILPRINKKADFAMVLGGTNDFGTTDNQSIPLGDINSIEPYDYYGALKSVGAYLLKFLTPSRIIYATPLKRDDLKLGYPLTSQNEYGKTFSQYVQAVRDVAKKYSFNLLDLNQDFYEYDPKKPQFNSLSDDGLHPNDLGHKELAQLISKRLKPLIAELGKK